MKNAEEKMVSVALTRNAKEKLKYISSEYGMKIYECLDFMVNYFYENKENGKEFFKVEKGTEADEVLLKKINNLLTKQTNRVIGFIKNQDKDIETIYQEIRDSEKRLLFKMMPLEEQQLFEAHPLFDDYQEIIDILQELIKIKGCQDVENELKDQLGDKKYRQYMQSVDRITQKSFL